MKKSELNKLIETAVKKVLTEEKTKILGIDFTVVPEYKQTGIELHYIPKATLGNDLEKFKDAEKVRIEKTLGFTVVFLTKSTGFGINLHKSDILETIIKRLF